MAFFIANRIWFGIAADTLTLAGGLVLAYEAFCRLKDMIAGKINTEFKQRFPDLPVVNEAEKRALRSVARAYLGCALLLLGYVLEVLTRIAEA